VRLLLYAIVLLSSGAFAQSKAPNDIAALKKMAKQIDKVENMTFYRHPAVPRYTNVRQFGLYIAASPTHKYLRFKTTYTGESWLFVQKLIIVIDGQRVESPPLTFERDNDTRVWEWLDTTAPWAIETAILASKAKTVIVRFSGRTYYRDITPTPTEKLAIQETLAAYRALPQRSQ
jgi:hypothetical protein